jgi:hypothetical protein
VKLIEEFVAEVKGLSMDGIKFSKQKNNSNAALKKFPKMKAEEKNLEKMVSIFKLFFT